MSGGDYTESFGERMKSFPRGKRRPQIHRAPLWIRFRQTWGPGVTKRFGPWGYCYWMGPLSGIRDFVRAQVGSFRQIEYLGPERPAIADHPFGVAYGVELFLEKSL